MYDHASFLSLMMRRPQAFARLEGSNAYPGLNGEVYFYQTNTGVLVVTQVEGLPTSTDLCRQPVFAYHIHEGDSCGGNETDPFAGAMSHYNPNQCPHPYHAGDMPPLFGCNGSAFSAFITDRFSVGEVIGKTVIIHSAPDDFTTQPSGNSGMKIACGVIRNAATMGK